MKTIFLSFAGTDLEKVKRLIPLLESDNYKLDLYDGPIAVDIDSEPAGEIKRAIGEKLVQAQVTLCLITENSHQSKWLAWQLEKSRQKGNKIIVMALKNTDCAVLPQVVREENLTFYPWDPKRLQRLITEEEPKLFR